MNLKFQNLACTHITCEVDRFGQLEFVLIMKRTNIWISDKKTHISYMRGHEFKTQMEKPFVTDIEIKESDWLAWPYYSFKKKKKSVLCIQFNKFWI